eukprot:scaffold1642_cov252-Pinguiococcus_pyrenoidosus.AAC.14
MEGRHRRFGGRGYRWCGSHDPTRLAATAPSTGTRLPFFLREGMVLNGAPSVQKAICRLTRWECGTGEQRLLAASRAMHVPVTKLDLRRQKFDACRRSGTRCTKSEIAHGAEVQGKTRTRTTSLPLLDFGMLPRRLMLRFPWPAVETDCGAGSGEHSELSREHRSLWERLNDFPSINPGS